MGFHKANVILKLILGRKKKNTAAIKAKATFFCVTKVTQPNQSQEKVRFLENYRKKATFANYFPQGSASFETHFQKPAQTLGKTQLSRPIPLWEQTSANYPTSRLHKSQCLLRCRARRMVRMILLQIQRHFLLTHTFLGKWKP
jgi:hypothetical protein